MKRIAWMAVAVGLFAFVAAPALADDSAPTARDIQAAVDSYLASASQDATLVGGPGSAGYDQGFWIRGGDFLLRINLTLQARYEYFDYDKDEEGFLFGDPNAFGQNEGFAVPWAGGDLSGFSMPRATLKFSGEAPCSIRYYTELEFGDPGWFVWTPIHTLRAGEPLGVHQPGLQLRHLPRGLDRVGRVRRVQLPHGPDQDAEHASADGGPRAPAVRRHLDGLGAHGCAAARLHRSQPRLRLHDPRRLRLQR